MPSVATTPTALKVIIDAGVTAQLPSTLVIKNKLIINGTLQINHTGTLNFTNYSATAIEGTGTLAFNGSGTTPSVTASSLTGFKDLSLSTNENITLTGIYKNITFTGTNAIITASAGIEITNPDVNAITGFSATNYIAGKITRAVNANGVYVFPNAQFNYYNNSKPEPTTLTLNNLTGTTKITVSNQNGASAPNINFASGKTTTVLGNYYWRIEPDVAPTGGTYDVNFSKSAFTNGVTDANRYVVLKRTDTSSPWTFEGVKVASTQTGGTTSGSTVSNATVTAGLTGLTKFSDFVISINSTPVPDATTVTASTWTGATNTEWNNVGNWSNGIPNATVDAIIPAGLTNYPAIYTTTDNARSLTINSGINGLKLHSDLILTNGLTNNSSIEIALLAGSNTVFKGYGGGISGSGKIRFEATGSITSTTARVVNNDLDINIGNSKSINLLGKFSGNINIISGLIKSVESGGVKLELTNPNSSISITSPTNHIAGKIYKTVNPTGSYQFPIGEYNNPTKKYGEIDITNNSIAASSVYNVWFSLYNALTVNILDGTTVISSYINSGQWNINPSVTSSTGTIDLVLKTSDYTNGRVSVDDYVLLRRSSANTTNPWTIVNGATITETGGTITVTANGLAPFSTNTMFCIGLKATTTTWTGTTSTDWNTASNWSNGVPSASVKAIIANASQYPSNPPTSGSAAAQIEIAAGSTLTLPSTFYTPTGIINNGTINISGGGSGTFYGFGSGSTFSTLSGTGKLVFGSNSPTTFDSYYMGSKVENSIEINNSAGLTLTRTTTFTGDVTLTNGIVTVPDYSYFVMNNPNATITGSEAGYVKGNLKRTVNATGTVNFPVGNTGIYAPVNLSLSSLTGTTEITANFSNAAISGQPSNLAIGGSTVNSILSGGSWFITPNAQPTAGTYTATLSAPIGSSTATDFYVLKRENNYSSYPWANLGTNIASTVTAGVVTASASGLTSFSQFGIGEGITTLPVKLSKFTAKADGNFASLYWETQSEINNDKFLIEKSLDGKEFMSIGEVDGKGNSTTINTYTFRDKSPAAGANYYRLKQIDFDGKFDYSDVRAVNFNFDNVQVLVYPNPANEVINLSGMDTSSYEVSIYNTIGELLFKEQSSSSTIKIPSKITTGTYVLQLKLNDGSTIVKKVSIER
ncbi:MAG: T9SS type A sorting domain-containing protein [Sphingobacteriales bacterium]|nr:T9SS type A sorting domain-containing protein [Sphingobacteriales bacterium]